MKDTIELILTASLGVIIFTLTAPFIIGCIIGTLLIT